VCCDGAACKFTVRSIPLNPAARRATQPSLHRLAQGFPCMFDLSVGRRQTHLFGLLAGFERGEDENVFVLHCPQKGSGPKVCSGGQPFIAPDRPPIENGSIRPRSRLQGCSTELSAPAVASIGQVPS